MFEENCWNYIEQSCLQIQKEFAFGLYELDYDVFGVHIEGAVNRVPCLEHVWDYLSNIYFLQDCFLVGNQEHCLRARVLHARPQADHGRGSESSRFLSWCGVQQCWDDVGWRVWRPAGKMGGQRTPWSWYVWVCTCCKQYCYFSYSAGLDMTSEDFALKCLRTKNGWTRDRMKLMQRTTQCFSHMMSHWHQETWRKTRSMKFWRLLAAFIRNDLDGKGLGGSLCMPPAPWSHMTGMEHTGTWGMMNMATKKDFNWTTHLTIHQLRKM